jgi:hypothetical protein
MGLARRQQRLHLLPELIGQPPSIVRFDQAHDISPSSLALTQIDRNLSLSLALLG